MSGLILNGDTSGSVTLNVPAVAGSSTVTLPSTTGNIPVLPTGYSLGAGDTTRFKNRIINGDMRIDQRNSGASVALNSSIQYRLDRWNTYCPTGSGHTVQQVVDAPAGFYYSQKVTIGTGASPGSTAQNQISQQIEGYNVADFNLGAASAVAFTVSFWVKSSLTGTFNISFQNSASNRAYVTTYTINSANAWEQKTITLTGDTAGTWLKTNGTGLTINFSLGCGSTFNTTANTWTGSDVKSTSGSTNVVATSGATWFVTGVQLEVGSQATSFEYCDYGTQLALCQRYYNNYGFASNQWYINATTSYTGITFPQMRASPSVASTGAQAQYGPGGQLATSVAAFGSTGPTHSGLSLTQSGGAASNAPGFCWGSVQLSAEL